MSSSGEEKTEKPTPKKKKENRKEGQVPRTQELGAWLSVLTLGMFLPSLLSREFDALRELLVDCFRVAADPEVGVALGMLGHGLRHAATALLVLSLMVMLIGVSSALGQGGFFLATKSVKPKWSKLNPISGMKRIFGPQAAWEAAKVLLKSAVFAFVAYGAIKAMLPLLGGLIPVHATLEIVGERALGLIRNVAIAGVVMAAADYAFQRRKVGKQTRMTKQEVKQEHKQAEGDPLLKSAIRSRQLAASRNRMIADIADADVVLVNPTHVAIALRYDAEKGAPRVVARGAGAIATRIRQEAVAQRVPLVRDIPLARALHRSTKVGQEIPAELFAAVAQVLAFVISRRTRGQHGGEHRSPRTLEELPEVLAAGRRRVAAPAHPSTPPNPSAPAIAGR